MEKPSTNVKPLKRANAFTMIEMLVVIAIVAVLASLIMPALQSSIDSARSLQCANCLRQTGMVMANFANDNQNRYPGRAKTSSTDTWHEILSNLSGGNIPKRPIQRKACSRGTLLY